MSDGGNAGQASVSSLSQVRIVWKYTFLNYFRARRFYIMLAIVLLMSGLLTFAAGYYRPPFFGFGVPTTGAPSLLFYSAWWGGFVALVTLLSVAFFGGDAISGEFQNKTGYFLIPNPLRRSVIYVGKWLAALAASSLILGLFALIALGNGLYFFGTLVPYQFAESIILAWINLAVILTLAFMFSSLFKTSAISILMTVILLLFVFNILDTVVATIAGVEPWFSITYAGGIVSNILQDPYPAAKTTLGGGGFSITGFNASIPEGLAIMAVYFAVTALLGLILFERKQFT